MTCLAPWCLLAVVVRVHDGDTFLADGLDGAPWVRIEDIDAPELNAPCQSARSLAAAARDALAQMIPPGSTVQLTQMRPDKYPQRIDAVVTFHGLDIGAELIRRGLAKPWRYGHERRPRFCP